MEDNPQYEKMRWVHFGACALNVFLVLTTVLIVLSKSNYASPFTEEKSYVLVYLTISIGIESIGMFGAYFEHSSLTTNYICIYVIKLIFIFALLSHWGYIIGVVIVFYVVSFITSILFLGSLSDELQRRQMNHVVQYIASPQVLPLQSTFPSLREQSPIQPLPGHSTNHELFQQPLPLPLPLHHHHHHYHYHPAALSDDRSPSPVINVMEMTATTTSSIATSSPEKPTLSSNE